MLALQVIAQVLKVLPDLIEALENLFPEKGQGITKLEMLKGLVKDALATMDASQGVFEKVWPMVSPIVNMLVAKYNANGKFIAKS